MPDPAPVAVGTSTETAETAKTLRSPTVLAPGIVRGVTTLIGAAGLVGLAVCGLWLGIRPADRIARRVFWSSIVLAWSAVGGIVVLSAGVFIDCALVG